jgi:O6-methylguanine-DNA--protein-cysteine methyltransferase
MKIGYTIAKSPLGKVLVAATERGVSAVYLGDAESKLISELREEYPRAEISLAPDSYQRWVREIVQRIEGKQPRLELPLDLQATAFQRRVWQELQRIPRGRTRTYSEVARSLGQPNACWRKNARLRISFVWLEPLRRGAELGFISLDVLRRLSPWLLHLHALGPVGLELPILDLQVFLEAGVVREEVIVGAGFEKLLLEGQPRRLVDPHPDSGDLAARLVGFRSKFQHDGLVAVEILFSGEGHQVILFQAFAFGSKSQREILVGHRTMLADVVFFDAVDFWSENIERIPVPKDRSLIGLQEINAHFIVAPYEDVAGFRGSILHDGRVLDVFNVGGERVKVLRGLVHHRQDAFEGPFGVCLCRTNLPYTVSAAKPHQREQKKSSYQNAAPMERMCNVLCCPSEC